MRRFRAKTKSKSVLSLIAPTLAPYTLTPLRYSPSAWVAGFVWLPPEVKDKSQPTRQTGVF
jgi:hypothetical protein